MSTNEPEDRTAALETAISALAQRVTTLEIAASPDPENEALAAQLLNIAWSRDVPAREADVLMAARMVLTRVEKRRMSRQTAKIDSESETMWVPKARLAALVRLLEEASEMVADEHTGKAVLRDADAVAWMFSGDDISAYIDLKALLT